MDRASLVAGIGALAEPTRRRLYDYVVAQPGPVGREQAARELDLPLHTVSFHLDRLVRDELLEVEYRRLGQRTGPGSGRPSKLYRRAAREVAVSLPPRRYDLVGEVLAAGVARALAGTPLEASLEREAAEAGRVAGEEAAGEDPVGGGPGEALEALAATLEPLGYEPRRTGPEDADAPSLLLANCPFHALAQRHTELVCGLNQHFVQGVAEGLGRGEVQACLEPGEGRCCVVARLR
ncbi:helix-turn-helix domain-containing protein [Ornithinimicrobium humiphilum]|uniref:Putative ArsR family transcriptional regulator n=1 Tax=Ornithinimicrobium humiphilum TaxID=125288 RepID=A0A543KJK5_9MICO|nr:helix-turn-helix domain-containing protein [Ornithinimicrobium humiphilum]TQM95263.1 putative ArsR family transcriptional regulator [Ornithinimicrobium humiphilum]